MPDKANLLFETAEGKRDYVSLQIKGAGVLVNAAIAELKPERRAELTKRIRSEVSTMIDRPAFPSQSSFDDAVNITADKMIVALNEAANDTGGVKVRRNEQGDIIETFVHKSVGDVERRVLEVLHDADRFRAPFLVEIANRERLNFIITEKSSVASIIPAGQRDPHVEARTMRYIDPETGERRLQQVFVSIGGKANDSKQTPDTFSSPQERLINGFAHETIHNTKLDQLFSSKIEKGGAGAIDKLIADDIAHLEAIDRKLKQVLSTRPSTSPQEDFASISKTLELNGALAPLFELALEGFDKRAANSNLSAHDLRQAVEENGVPSVLPEGVTARDYANGLRDAVKIMSEHTVLPMHMMHHFPPDRYPDRKAVLNEYPGQVFSAMALKGMAATECLLPRLTPVLCEAVQQTYGIDAKNFTLPQAAQEKSRN